MRIPRIYTEQPLTLGATIDLEESPSRHIAKVLRMTVGRELTLFNGQGGEFTATISQLEKKHTSVTLNAEHTNDRESPLNIELCIGLSRGERMDWIIQKATELGVTKITPLFTERSEVKLKPERLDKKMQHWQQIIISACEQCQRNRLPNLNTPQNINQYIPSCQAQLKLVLHHRSDTGLSERDAPTSIALLIGPEGGLNENEIAQAESSGFVPLTLGPRVLRTETAPLVALSLCQQLWGDF